jgi:hypothetical protein
MWGAKYETPRLCVYELRGEKIQQHRALYDRLSIGKQAAKGWFAKKLWTPWYIKLKRDYINVFIN